MTTTTEPERFPFTTAEQLNVDPMFAELRRDQPLCRVRLPYGDPAWLVTRYEDVRTVFGDPRFSRAAAVERDEPRLVAKAFTVRRVEELRPRAERIADELVDAMIAKGAPADLVEDFALPLQPCGRVRPWWRSRRRPTGTTRCSATPTHWTSTGTGRPT